jgi:uncharacterized protein YbjT (DUF2867 family)
VVSFLVGALDEPYENRIGRGREAAEDPEHAAEVDIGAHRAGALSADDHLRKGRERVLRGICQLPVGSHELLADGVHETAVAGLGLDQEPRESAEPVPGIGLVQRVAAGSLDLRDPVSGDGLEQGLFAGEASINGANADAGANGDRLDRDPGSFLGNGLARGLEQSATVAFGVHAKRTPRNGEFWQRAHVSGSIGSGYASVTGVSSILVTGGSGVLGSHVARLLRERGHDVRVLSRQSEVGTHRGDLTSGEGVADALDGVELVVHAASDTPQGRTDLRQTRTLLDAEQHLRHLVYVSIVGIDAMPYGYYGRKLACEQAIAGGSVPHTIQRATQFHELLERGLRAAGRLPLAPLPLPLAWQVQPIAAAEVAQRIVALLGEEPGGRAVDLGGPEVLTAKRVVDVWRARHERPRTVANVHPPGRTARAFRRGLNTTPEHADGVQTWEQFVRKSA